MYTNTFYRIARNSDEMAGSHVPGTCGKDKRICWGIQFKNCSIDQVHCSEVINGDCNMQIHEAMCLV
jgi:hypothetical protein